MDITTLDELVAEYNMLLVGEDFEQRAVEFAQSGVDAEKNRILSDAYRAGIIDGKTEAIKRIQESELLEASSALDFLDDYLDQCQCDLADTTAERKALEAKIGLYKAWMYSQFSKP